MAYLPMDLKKHDPLNSFDSPLGVSGSTSGSWVKTDNFALLIVAIVTDQPSATDGLKIELSVDGVTAVPHYHSFLIDAHSTKGHHFASTLDCNYYRITYTNGTTAQTIFNLQSTLFANPPEEGHVHPLEFALSPDHQASTVRAVLCGKNPSGAYDNIGRTTGGNLKVSFEEVEASVSEKINLYPAGTGQNGSVTLTSANTAYAVPGTAPTSSYRITLENQSDAVIYLGYQNTNANGIRVNPGAKVEDDLGSGQQLYAYCASAGKSITYTLKKIG